jgi:hypothetical protein
MKRYASLVVIASLAAGLSLFHAHRAAARVPLPAPAPAAGVYCEEMEIEYVDLPEPLDVAWESFSVDSPPGVVTGSMHVDALDTSHASGTTIAHDPFMDPMNPRITGLWVDGIMVPLDGFEQIVKTPGGGCLSVKLTVDPCPKLTIASIPCPCGVKIDISSEASEALNYLGIDPAVFDLIWEETSVSGPLRFRDFPQQVSVDTQYNGPKNYSESWPPLVDHLTADLQRVTFVHTGGGHDLHVDVPVGYDAHGEFRDIYLGSDRNICIRIKVVRFAPRCYIIYIRMCP